MRKPQRAFTLVELLVVIGIIAILIGILIPVVGAVKKAAYAASSRNNIKNIANAIDSYQVTYSAYPGVFSNPQIAAGILLTNGGTNALTMSENCLLSLTGGMTGATGGTYFAGDVGRGPLSFGTSQKRLQGFVDATNKAMSTTGSDLDPSVNWGSLVPEFIDAFPNSMPIIYLRATVGAPGVVAAGTAQYDARQLLPYAAINGVFAFDTNTFAANASDQPNPSGNYPTSGGQAYPNVKFPGSFTYFSDASLSAGGTLVPKRKDTYMLISPGEDRKYGTSDDICNFSF